MHFSTIIDQFSLRLLIALSLGLATTACYSQHKTTTTTTIVDSEIDAAKGATLLKRAVAAHGGAAYETAHYQFVFRGNTYTFQNQKDNYTYTKNQTKDGKTIIDKMDNKNFVRMVDGTPEEMTDKQVSGYKEGLNSVIYFATLPHKLLDKAVNPEFQGVQSIRGQDYDIIKVTFDKKGGGKDYEDTYLYWINRKTSTMDFLAYSYKVNGGGVRFRTAYNTRTVDGIVFQDYVNYKAAKTTSLFDLPALWVANDLKELSRIETEEVKNMNY